MRYKAFVVVLSISWSSCAMIELKNLAKESLIPESRNILEVFPRVESLPLRSQLFWFFGKPSEFYNILQLCDNPSAQEIYLAYEALRAPWLEVAEGINKEDAAFAKKVLGILFDAYRGLMFAIKFEELFG